MILRKICLLFLTEQSGEVAIEYVIIGSIVSLAVIAGTLTIGGTLNNTLTAIAPRL